MPRASPSWSVSWRARARPRASTTHTWSHRSRWPTPSPRQSARRMRRAVTTRPFDSGPTIEWDAAPAATSARRDPSGDQAISETPCPGTTMTRAVPPSSAATMTAVDRSGSSGKERRNATSRPSGLTRGDVSRTAPDVRRTAPAVARAAIAPWSSATPVLPKSTRCRCERYVSPRTNRRTITAPSPPGSGSCSSSTTWRRRSRAAESDDGASGTWRSVRRRGRAATVVSADGTLIGCRIRSSQVSANDLPLPPRLPTRCGTGAPWLPSN